MANKQITIKQFNNNGYDTLYPQTSATQTVLSNKTSTSFGGSNVTVDSALNKIIKKLQADKKISVKVVDGKGNAVQGAKINGLLNSPVTNSNGIVNGVFVSDPLTIVSPYVDLNDTTVNGASYVGSVNTLTVTLPIAGENEIKRFTSSKSVKFSKMVKTVDVCCVGGGGGGSGGSGHYSSGSYVQASFRGKGGAGGNIVNSYNISVTTDTSYAISVGAGGVGSNTLIYSASYYGEEKHNPGGQGGSTTFLSVTATGGGGATSTSGVGTSNNGGNGGSGNATGTEFNDGATYYSGGGANGGGFGQTPPAGGTPYGGTGGYTHSSGSGTYGVDGGNGLGAGGGGGGGNANLQGSSSSAFNYMTKGGNGASGLVAIRFHF